MGDYKPTPWHYNVAHSIDVLANSLLGGLRRQTLSARLGHLARTHGKPPRGSVLGIGRVMYEVLEWIEPGHCERAAAQDDEIGDRR